MTKRMLSLLLALVMTLSLCVPALAADEFAAEAVTEVEEQAPEAPVVEEVIADEPVAVAAAADEPVAIATATSAQWKALQTAISDNADLYDDALAGEVIGTSMYLTKWLTGEDPELEDFIEAYKDALEIDQQDSDAAVTGATTTLTEAAKKVVDSLNPSGTFIAAPSGLNALIGLVGSVVNEDGAYKDNLQPSEFDTYYNFLQDMKAIKPNSSNGRYPVASVLKQLTRAYKTDKLSDRLVGVAHTFDGGTTKVDPTLKPGAAIKANDKDYTDLKAAYDKLVAARNGAASGDLDRADELINHIDSVVFSDTTKTGLADCIAYCDVQGLIKQINAVIPTLIQDARRWKFASWRLTESMWTLYIIAERPTGPADDMLYYIDVTLDGSTQTFDLASATTESTSETVGMRRYITVKKYDKLTKDQIQFKEGDVLTAVLRDADGNVYDQQTITITTNNDPKILNQGFRPASDNYYIGFSDNLRNFKATNYKLAITRPDGTTTNKAIDKAAQTNKEYTWKDSVHKVGDYTVKFTFKGSDGKEATQTVTITVSPISAYTNVSGNSVTAATPYGNKGYDSLQKAIAGAEGYEDLVPAKGETASLADIQAVVARHLKAANDIVAAAATTPYDSANVAKVNETLANLTAALKRLTTAADQSALIAALNAAAALKESDYIYGWADLQAAVKSGESVKKTAVKDNTQDARSIADAAKAINDAIKALTPKTADTAALKALVASVPAKLASDTYTEASKAAVNTALTAANAVLAKKTPLQSEVDKAAADLQTALAALAVETAPQGPKAPTGGTGWSEYNGVWYYFVNNVMKKNYWVTNGSNHNLWYHMGADGALDTGFQYIEDKTFGHGWYMLQGDDSNGMLGAMLTGWQDTKIAGMGWFIPNHNGNYGDCTWTKAWGNYYPIANTWDVGGSHITK